MQTYLKWLVNIALTLAVFVVMLGAYTRLTDAGLGCPDWPGCYGKMVLPSSHEARADAQALYPAVPIEAQKAWTEMAHRYAAGSLGLLIVVIAGFSCFGPRESRVSPLFGLGLLLLLAFQALLGMWTVTLQLLPVVVMGHLLGGMTIASFLTYYRLKLGKLESVGIMGSKLWAYLGLVIVFLQIALGGWVSSNYAGLACLGFPQCNQHWWPTLDMMRAFDVLSPVGANYQGGVLDSTARVTIQWVHRLGAVVTLAYLSIMAMYFMRVGGRAVRWVSNLVLILVITQFMLGIVNILYMLPLSVAVLHNGVALLLLLAMVSLCYYVSSRGQQS